jgi:hypothetical protein
VGPDRAGTDPIYNEWLRPTRAAAYRVGAATVSRRGPGGSKQRPKLRPNWDFQLLLPPSQARLVAGPRGVTQAKDHENTRRLRVGNCGRRRRPAAPAASAHDRDIWLGAGRDVGAAANPFRDRARRVRSGSSLQIAQPDAAPGRYGAAADRQSAPLPTSRICAKFELLWVAGSEGFRS